MEEFIEKAKAWLGENFGELYAKLKPYAKKVGRAATKPLLQLYFVLKEPSTPNSDKALIIAALVYTLVPTDLIPFRKWGILGWLDDAFSFTYAYNKVKKYITPEIEREVESVLAEWFDGVGVVEIKD